MYTKMTSNERFQSLHPFTTVTQKIKEFGHQLAHASRMRRDRQLLQEMPDRMLRDIGISRHEINSVTSWRGRDTSRRFRD